MSKWSVRETWDGNYVVEEVGEVDFMGIVITVLVILGFIIIVCPMILIGDAINTKRQEKEEARELARIEAQMLIEASVWELDVVKNEAIYGKNRKFDSYGNEYTGEYREFCSWSNKESTTVVNLRNDYDRFTGVIFTRPEQNEELAIRFWIYGDDVCLYDSGEMHASTPAKNINIDIDGVDTLKFVAVSSQKAATNPAIILENAMVHAE